MTFRLFEKRDNRVLYQRTLQPDGRPQPGWRNEEVDLSLFEGQTVRLVWEATSGSPADAGKSLPLLADPVVVAPIPEGDRPDIIRIVIDTLRADQLGAYGLPLPTSPFLDRLSRRSATFASVVASAPWTLPSHVSMFTGRDALVHGINFDARVPERFMTAADYFRDAGYLTQGMTGGAYLSPHFGLDQGFRRFRYAMADSPHATGDDLGPNVAAAIRFLRSRPPAPFYLFFHTYEVHAPYRCRQPWFSRFHDGGVPWKVQAKALSKEDNPDLIGLKQLRFMSARRERLRYLADAKLARHAYEAGVGYTDWQMARLFRALATTEAADATVVVTSDHGEALGEMGFAGHLQLYDFNLLVPLLISLPETRKAANIVRRQVRLTDLLPTFLDLLKANEIAPTDGKSLLGAIRGRGARSHAVAISYAGGSNHGIAIRIDNRYKLIVNNSAWRRLFPGLRAFDLGCDGREARTVTPPLGTDERLAKLQRRYLRQTPYLLIDVRNQSPQPLQVVLQDVPDAISRLKSFDGDPGMARFIPGGAEIKFRPYSGGSYYWEGEPPADWLRVALRAETGTPFNRSVRWRDVLTDCRFAFDGFSWRLNPSGFCGDVPTVRLGFKNVHDDRAAGAPPQVIQRQLKRLGYLN